MSEWAERVLEFALRWFVGQYRIGWDDAEDLAQKVCLKLCRQPHRLVPSKFRCYLIRTLRNTLIDHLRCAEHRYSRHGLSLETMRADGYHISERTDPCRHIAESWVVRLEQGECDEDA